MNRRIVIWAASIGVAVTVGSVIDTLLFRWLHLYPMSERVLFALNPGMLVAAIPLVAVGGGPDDMAAELIVWTAWLFIAVVNAVVYGSVGLVLVQFLPKKRQRAESNAN